MSHLPLTPILIGVADIKNRGTSLSPNEAHEPSKLMLRAIQSSLIDTSLPNRSLTQLQSSIDSISVVATWTWNYHDLPGLLGEKLGVKNVKYKVLSHHGGDSPAKLLDEAAARVGRGEVKVAVVVGGEALATLGDFAAAGQLPPPHWTPPDPTKPTVSLSNVSRFGENLGTRHSVGLPIHVYPLYENAFRAHRNQSIKDNNTESAKLYAEFAEVAEKNPVAWNYGKPAADEAMIGTVSKKNRMICFPYPLLMNAFNNVNLASACILTSTDFAKELGVPEEKWVYPLGGAGTSDSSNFWERPNYHTSPSISRSLDAALAVSGLTKDDIDTYDFYSCFPIVPKLACHHLSLPILNSPKPITLLGGLTSFGGAGNNYSMHAITAMSRRIRSGSTQNGLVLANGGIVTYQHVICLSSQPRKDGSAYPAKNPLPELLDQVPAPPVDEEAEGEATVETYTIEFSRDGTPLRGFVVGRLTASGHRFLANHADTNTLQQLCSIVVEPIGKRGWVRVEEDAERKGKKEGKRRNLFSFEEGARL